MTWPESLADDLPAPRDDEPESLRRDIADELADHLDCALRKELHATPDKEQAHRKVLQRFGDPKTIARRLWFDALKEKIMSQRIMLALAVVMTLACLAAAGLVWSAINSGQTAMAALVEQSRAMHEALLARLEKQSPAPTTPDSLEWSEVRIRLLSKNLQAITGTSLTGPEGLPHYFLNLKGHVLQAGVTNTIPARIGEDGVADFGLVRIGEHQLEIQTTFAQHFNGTITVRPGEPYDEALVCPKQLPEMTEITCTVDWPDDLREKELWLVAGFEPRLPQSERFASPRALTSGNWTLQPFGPGRLDRPPNYPSQHVVLIGPQGEVIDFEPRDLGMRTSHTGQQFYLEMFSRSRLDSEFGVGATLLGYEENDRTVRVRDVRFAIPSRDAKEGVRWSAGDYMMSPLVVTAPPTTQDGGLVADAVAGINWGRFAEPSGFVFANPLSTRYEAVSNGENHWKITLPDELLTIIREHLAAKEAQPADDAE